MTPTLFLNTLETLENTDSWSDCDVLVQTAARFIQSATLAPKSSKEFRAGQQLLSQASKRYPVALKGLFDNALNFHSIEGSDLLGLWLLPVMIQHKASLDAKLPLKKSEISSLRVSGAILKSMGISFKFDEVCVGAETLSGNGSVPSVGWVHIVPELYAYPALRKAAFRDLLALPSKARKHVSGQKGKVTLPVEGHEQPPGTSLYFLPIVVKHPEGRGRERPQPSQQLVKALRDWICTSLIEVEKDNLRVFEYPAPFSIAMLMTPLVGLGEQLQASVSKMIQSTGFNPSALSALIGLYDLEDTPEFLQIGISFSVRVTDAPLAYVLYSVSIDHLGAAFEVLEQRLEAMGLKNIEVRRQLAHTSAIQSRSAMPVEFPHTKSSLTSFCATSTMLH